jgi:hypothetical protein
MLFFLRFGFTHGRLVNCFHLFIPVCGADIPAPLVDVAPEGRDSRQSVKVWRRKKREATRDQSRELDTVIRIES